MTNDDVSLLDFMSPVFTVLQQPNQLAGIGLAPAMFIMILTIILTNLISIWCLSVGIILYIVARLLCKKDPFALTVLFERLMQPYVWEA